MALKCVAVDDEPLALQLLQTYANRMPSIRLAHTFEDALSGIEYLDKNPVDVLFLDINMPDISGIDLARALKVKPLIIFTTAYRQFAYEGFQLDAIDYLLKPISFDAFSKAVQKAIAYRKHQEQSAPNPDEAFIYVHSKYRLIKISVQEIEYIESLEDYIKIHTGTEKPIVTLMTLKKIMDMLPFGKFTRIHRSYIINSQKIKAIQFKKVQMHSVLLPIGDAYATQLKQF